MTAARFIGGDSHGQPVPQDALARMTYVVDRQHYVRHDVHYVIFGMAPHRAAELIAALVTTGNDPVVGVELRANGPLTYLTDS